MDNYILQYFIHQAIIGYVVSTSLFLILTLFFKSFRKKLKPFLNVSNAFLLVFLTINFLFVLNEAIICRNGSNGEEKMNSILSGLDFYNSRICFMLFFIPFIKYYLFQLFFLSKKIRENVFTTIFTLITFTFYLNYNYFLFYITNNINGFLPTKWINTSNQNDILFSCLFSIIYFLFCWIISNKK